MQTPRPTALPTETSVWYVSYGSNMSAARFACYLEGGRPEGGSRAQPRRPRRAPAAPRRAGGLSPARSTSPASRRSGAAGWRSTTTRRRAPAPRAPTWSPRSSSPTSPRRRCTGCPSPGDPLAEVVLGGLGGEGERHHVGPGRYETLVEVGTLDGLPMRRSPRRTGWTAVPHTAPAPAYVAMLAPGWRSRTAGAPRGPRPTSGARAARRLTEPERRPDVGGDGAAPRALRRAGLVARSEVDRAEHPRDPVRDLLVAPVEVAGPGSTRAFAASGSRSRSLTRPSTTCTRTEAPTGPSAGSRRRRAAPGRR